ncbi:hypothetical protein CALVIDRAFT_540742 [Calocera viscosa TUFC12733]|uniref:Uncharacterized protein n=1 Tax=Calocera viscosa (strain TUFC12733) TaxID=1330018 RepID=A0A167IHR9_CALVF|nr:hypothetical protein CALVIDRAFT_540742 [Calocera viscosa TUFC12733]
MIGWAGCTISSDNFPDQHGPPPYWVKSTIIQGTHPGPRSSVPNPTLPIFSSAIPDLEKYL